MDKAYVARQGIFHRSGELYAYELLFRSDANDRTAAFTDPVLATSQVAVAAVVDIGPDVLLGRSKGFLNVDRSALLSSAIEALEPERFGLEILEDVPADDDVRGALLRLRTHGYTVALDDFVDGDARTGLLDLVDIVKVDVSAVSLDAVERIVRTVAPFDVRLVAERVEERPAVDTFAGLGFDLFQGFYFFRPQTMSHPSSPSRIATLELLARIHEPDIGFDRLAEVIERDVSLTYRLLRVVNSAAFGLTHHVDSVRQALALLGTSRIRRWASLMLLAGGEEVAEEVVVTACVRARMCENIAVALGRPHRERYFTVGLLSALDALLDAPLPLLLARLPLGVETLQALLHHEGELGTVLDAVLAYERGEWGRVEQPGIDEPLATSAYLDALRWADTTVGAVAGATV